MFMKKYIILSLLCIGLGGCNSWLDVTSDQEVYEESMFEQGILHGIKRVVYPDVGRNVIWGKLELWSYGGLV